MKAMKRIVAGLLVLGMMLAAVGCGAEQTVKLSGDLETLPAYSGSGLAGTETMILDAKGDTVQKITVITSLDLSSYDDEIKEALITALSETFASAQDINGVTFKETTGDSSYTIELTVDCTNSDAVKNAAAEGFIQLEGNAGKISLKVSQSGLEAAGYKVVE